MKTIAQRLAGAVFLLCVHVGASADPALPSLIATFATATDDPANTTANPPAWELRRGQNCVVAIDTTSGVAERWKRDPEGRVWYQRVFPGEQKIIEYQPVDLRLGGVERKWDTIASVLDPRALDQLTLLARPAVFQERQASAYRGSRDGARWEVAWLADESIPARVRIEGVSGASTLQLIRLELTGVDDAVCELPNVRTYESIDFADLGDRHADAFIERLMHQDGPFSGHRH